MSRINITTELIDESTGEYTRQVKTISVKKSDSIHYYSTFVEAWLVATKTIKPHSASVLLAYLMSRVQLSNGSINDIALYGDIRKKACEFLDCSNDNLTKLLKILLKANCIKKTSHSVYAINPNIHFKGSEKQLKKAKDDYENIGINTI